MKSSITAAIITIVSAFVYSAGAQIYDTNNDTVGTFAGYGIPGYVDGQGQLTAFSGPSQIVADTASNLYVWDGGNARIRKITPDGTVSTFAGGGTYLEGYGTNVSLSWGTVGSMAIDHANNLWLVMNNGYYGSQTYLLTVGTNGFVSIINGYLTNLTTYSSLCFDSEDNLYYSGGNQIYRFNAANAAVQVFAGSGAAGYYDGPGPLFSAFASPRALACDLADNIYVWDSGNGVIRRIDPLQNVTSFTSGSYYYYQNNQDGAGTNVLVAGVTGMFFDHQGNLYLIESSCVRKIDAQTNAVTLAGSFSQSGGQNSFANGPGNQARFYNAMGGCFAQGMVFVADTGNNRIRNITFNAPSQTAPPAGLQLNTYPGLQITGNIGRTYQIQTSSDMQTWNPAATVLLNSNPYLWIDQNPASGKKFYRAVMLP